LFHRKQHKKEGEKMNLEKLKRFRMAKGLNQTEFAEKLGVDRSYYSQIENGRVPSMALLEKIAEALGKNLKDFF
jgi:transcriptional regulator with XRE-family HTH domain